MRWITSVLMEILSLSTSLVFLQGEFDGVLREEVVAEKLYKLGRSGSGTEQVYLSLTLSVSMRSSPLAGYILTLVGPHPFSLVLIPFLVAPKSQSLACDGEWRWVIYVWHQRALASPIISPLAPRQVPLFSFPSQSVSFILSSLFYSNQCFPSRRLNLIL